MRGGRVSPCFMEGGGGGGGVGRKNLSLQRAEAGVGTAGIWAEGRSAQGQQGKEKSVMAS